MIFLGFSIYNGGKTRILTTFEVLSFLILLKIPSDSRSVGLTGKEL